MALFGVWVSVEPLEHPPILRLEGEMEIDMYSFWIGILAGIAVCTIIVLLYR